MTGSPAAMNFFNLGTGNLNSNTIYVRANLRTAPSDTYVVSQLNKQIYNKVIILLPPLIYRF